jgi:predicted PurR-regulated permease PerM
MRKAFRIVAGVLGVLGVVFSVPFAVVSLFDMRNAPRPRGPFRRFERWIVGLVFAVMAFVVEKAVLRSIRRGRTTPKPSGAGEPLATSTGTDVSGQV